MPKKTNLTKRMVKYISGVNDVTDVCAFVCDRGDVGGLRAAFRRKKTEGQRLTFRTQGAISYGIIAIENKGKGKE